MKINKIVGITSLALIATSQAYSHGYVESPASRALLCKNGDNTNCGERAQYEPQSIEQADGLFDLKALDNNLGSADVAGFEPLDVQEQSRWAKTVVRSGQPLNIKWFFTANHRSKHFKFYITKPNWDPNKLLTRSSFEDKPLNCYNPQPAWIAPNQPAKDGLTFTCTMPERSGYQIIMAEWDVDDTKMSFYNLLDLDFTNTKPAGTVIKPDGSSNTGGSNGDSSIQQYDKSKAYPTPKTEVIYNKKVYSNKWYVNPGQAPGSELYGPWQFVREHTDQTNPTDPFPIEGTKFTVDPANIKEGDQITLQLFKDGEFIDYPLITVPKTMQTSDLFTLLAEKINKLSADKLNNQIIAGYKNDNGDVVTGGNTLYIYQITDKPYSEISFYYQQASHNLKNELHLMEFKSDYNLDSNNSININGKIMSHSSATVDVSIVLQDSNGKEIYKKQNIQINPMDTYPLAIKIDNLAKGDYKLIISSILADAEAWQEVKDIKVEGPDSSNTPVNQDVNINIESNIPYYQINNDDSVTARTWFTALGEKNLSKQGITILAWNQASFASGNDSSKYITCPLPNNNQEDITYIVSGDLNNITCKIK